MRKNIVIIFTILIAFQTSAQDLYFPIEYRKAYENGTRKYDGTVSETYWQNRAAYDIRAEVDPVNSLLTAKSEITYTNNSPDSLRHIVFHAYHDYYKPGATRAGFFSGGYNEDLLSDGMVIDLIQIEGNDVDMEDKKIVSYNGTNYRIKLDQPLAPGSSISLKIDWHYSIPGEGFERSGAIDSTSMFIAYWYPEMAVYDDINGWDRIRYDASAEFYHDNSDFKVEITAPETFVVWASVAPSNGKDIYPKDVLKRLEKARKSDESVTILGAEDYEKGVKMNATTWKFEAKDFPDFSFALSDHFIWEAATYEDEYGTYFLNTAYNPDNPAFSSVIRTQQKSLEIFHNDFPAYPFPFKHFTIFNGLKGGGMEFAGMANDQSNSGEQYSRWVGKEVSDYEANLGLTLHEMYHMYFPFLMGINEKRYAWMDEGMASFADYFIPQLSEGNWDKSYLGRQFVVPMMVPTYTTPNHSGINSYTVGSYSYYSLYHLLGADMFKKCMNAYIERWKQKHPTPYDYMLTFSDVSGMDLDWFWKGWYFDWGYADLEIKAFDNGQLTVENSGGRPLAFKLTYTFEDESTSSETISPEVWKDSKTFDKTVSFDKEVRSIRLSILGGSDAVLANNTWPKED